jgi:fructosamine-3-kinase
MDTQSAIEMACGQPARSLRALGGGCIGQVYRVQMADGRWLVAKVDPGCNPRLDIEGYMLRYLAQHSTLPLPHVLHSAPDLLLMSWLEGRSQFGVAAQENAAMLLCELHATTAPKYGLERDTLIGGLHQPNTQDDSWIHFFGEHRLRYMANEAASAGHLPVEWLQRIDRLAARLDKWLAEPGRPSLIHGDIWTTNVLAQSGRISGFIDPAIYYADREIELAFITLFGTFGEPFFMRYQELWPIAPGFWEERRELYNLYPLLVHCRLFGYGYAGQVDANLRRFGF